MQSNLKLFSKRFISKNKKNKNSKLMAPAFSLQEILIIAVIIVVIAVIAVITIMNSNEEKFINGLQKANNSIGRAFLVISKRNELPNISQEEFTKKVLSRYIKLKKVCKNPQDCGFPAKIKRADGTVLESTDIPIRMDKITVPLGVTALPNIKKAQKNQNELLFSNVSKENNTTKKYNNAYFFVTKNGYHVMFFYNPYCAGNALERPHSINKSYIGNVKNQLSLDTVCLWGIYDMNGNKGPNQVGKDIGFVGSFYRGKNAKLASVLPSSSRAIKTVSLEGGIDHAQRAIDYCKTIDGNKYKLPTINELSLIYLNRKFFVDKPETPRMWFWSSSELPDNDMQLLSLDDGNRGWSNRMNDRSYAYCVKKMQRKSQK